MIYQQNERGEHDVIHTLKAVIIDRGYTVPQAASLINITPATLRAKLADILNIENEEMQKLFF